MFFTIKEQSFSQREKRQLDLLETMNMEEELRRAREVKAQKEQDTLARAATEMLAPK